MGAQPELVVVGTFENAADARQAVRDLRDASFSDRDIGVLTHGEDGQADVASFRDLEGNKAGKAAAVGVAAGAGGGALWALGVAAGLLPAIGPVIAGGLLAAVAASAAAGAGAGAVVGTLVGLGIQDEEAAYYDAELRKGRTILTVRCGDRPELVETIFRAHAGAIRELLTPLTLAQQIRGAGA